jgi:hypothetical protein
MRALLTIALCLATGLACAQPVVNAKLRMEKMPQPQKPAATVAVTLTDDADSVMLPAFAMRTTPLPMRFLRLGIEWKF